MSLSMEDFAKEEELGGGKGAFLLPTPFHISQRRTA